MIAIIANPAAHNFSFEKLIWVKKRLEENKKQVDIFITKKAGDGTEITKKIDGIYDTIAGFGGDGIINEIINAPLKKSALAVLPAGTTNVLAIELFGLPNLKTATESLINGKKEKAYLGKINQRRFILMAGAGFDAESVYHVNPKIKRFSGKLAYILGGIKAFLEEDSECFKLKIDDKEYLVLWAIVSKIKHYAGRFKISKSVDLKEPKFELFFCECKNRKLLLPYCNAALFSGMHNYTNLSFIHKVITNKEITIKGTKIQIDGDYFPQSEAVITVAESIELVR
ncbi:diacylglycerol/lipid kinase family protein [Hippea alviniae]|uniref:diacylglycerol/lipid kinase family protein n=1 Tax=Hippea alviniae TaxID=1279027 RepID=UPI0003B6F47F|nr:diacylglycerol kinase family protein [Hippea alviniae]